MIKPYIIPVCVHVIPDEILSSLEAVSGRKHPNTVQAKQLKNSLPLIHIFMHLVTSQVKIEFVANQGPAVRN